MKARVYDISGMLLIFVVIVIMFVAFVLLYINIYTKRHKKYLGEKKLLFEQFQMELLKAQLEIQEKTLKNISQEIHDNIGQTLTMAKLNLSTMEVLEEQKEKITMTKSAISKAIGDLRDLSRSLNTDHISDLGLQRAVESELELLRKSSGLETRLEVIGESFSINRQSELIIFRMIQEALTNIVKHASAREVRIEMKYFGKQLELVVLDDGSGFSMSSLSSNLNQGLGLRNMKNRAALLGADISIGKRANGGTELKLILPGAAEDISGLNL